MKPDFDFDIDQLIAKGLADNGIDTVMVHIILFILSRTSKNNLFYFYFWHLECKNNSNPVPDSKNKTVLESENNMEQFYGIYPVRSL